MAAAGIKICVDLKRKRVFPLFWFFTWERESVCTLFFHEDETHLFLYHAQMGNGCIKFHFKKGERKNRIDLITAVNFFFFLVEISSSICLQKDRETLFFFFFFLPMDRALLRIGYISKWSGKFGCCCCCRSLRFELFRSRSCWALGFRLMLFRHYSALTNSSLSRDLFSRVSAKKDRAYSTA